MEKNKTRTAGKKGLKLIIYMLNDLEHFRNIVVNDGTCEDRSQIKFFMCLRFMCFSLMKNGNVMGFRGYRFFSPKSSNAKNSTLGTSEANFGGKKRV